MLRWILARVGGPGIHTLKFVLFRLIWFQSLSDFPLHLLCRIATFRSNLKNSQKDFNPITRADAHSPPPWPSAVPIHVAYIAYVAAKSLAETAAWKIARRPTTRFSLSTILPTFILGPCILPISVKDDREGVRGWSFSNELIWHTATGGEKSPKRGLLDLDFPVMVDVRDVAKAHVAALLKEEAQGERFFVHSAGFNYTEVSLLGVGRKRYNGIEFKHGADYIRAKSMVYPASKSHTEKLSLLQGFIGARSKCESVTWVYTTFL